MAGELARIGHPMLVALLTVGLASIVQAEAPLPEATEPKIDGGLTELELLKEEETVSIASRYEEPISQAPSNVYVITDEDIRQSGAPDIPTILRRVPGLEVMQVTGADFNVSIRGDNQLAANKLLVMVDGRSIYVDTQGQVYWKAIPVTLPEIKRIEVLKGPASVLYGFNAFDGIINIITKSPEEMRGTTLQFGGGSYGTISSAAIHAGTAGKLGYRLSVGHDQTQQWRNSDALAFRSNKFNVQTEYATSGDSKIRLSGGLVDVNRFDGTVSNVSSLAETPALGYAHVVYERPNFYLRGFWNSYADTVQTLTNPMLAPFLTIADINGVSQAVFRGNTYNIEGQHTIDLWSANRLSYGINYRYNTLSSNFIDGYSTENRLGFYIQDEWKLADSFKIAGGVRYDLDTFITPTISPRFTMLYTPVQDHTFHATFAVGYRPPTLFEVNANSLQIITFPPPTPSPPPINFRGSSNLSPEEIISYEIGYQGWYFKHRVRLRTDLFFNHISNLISLTNPPTNDPGQADIYGGEAGMEFIATQWLSGFANFSYQEFGQSFTGDAQRGGPRFKWNIGLRGEWENGLSGEAFFHHYGSATYPISPAFSAFAAVPGTGVIVPNGHVGSYNLFNLRGAYKFWKQKASAGFMREAEVAISAFNSLNDRHQEHPLGDTIGSRVMGWLTVRF
jgi:outer membrane receptor for ferrienterochelin and colicin